MAKVTTLLCLCVISAVTCKPANNEQLDKATVNDVSINSVSGDKGPELPVDLTQQKAGNGASPPSTIQISGISTGVEVPVGQAVPAENPPFKPQRAGSMFAKFIDDIFQIPITVLQSVARLITNPFNQAKKDAAVTATVS